MGMPAGAISLLPARWKGLKWKIKSLVGDGR